MRWLWLQKNCHYVIEQRSPRCMNGEPDVMGVTKARYLVEIEIKRSLHDFKADAKKWHRVNRLLYLKSQPRWVYYLVPERLAEEALKITPEWAGLMCSNGCDLLVKKVAPINESSQKLTVKECVKMTRQMVAHTMGYAQWCDTHQSRFEQRDSQVYIDWVCSENGTYEI